MRKQVTYAAAMALLLSSCVTGQPGGMLASHSANPNDACGQAHADLFNSRGYFERSIAEGALTGAAAGALLGLAIGAASGKNMGQSAAIGAGAGLLVGGMGGYLNARQQQAKDNQELAGIVDGDIDREEAEVSRATVNFQRVSDCRKSAAERIKADYRAGVITRERAQAKLDEQKTLFQQELAEAEAIGAKIADRRKELNLAADKVLGEDPSAKATFETNQQKQAEWEALQAENARVAAAAEAKAQAQPVKAKAKAKPTATAAKASPPPPPPPPATVEPAATSKNAYNVAVKNDNLNKRSGDYATAVEDGKKLVASGGFDLAG